MEQKTSNWSKVFKKGVFVVVCIVAAILLLVGTVVGVIAIQRCAHGGRQVEAEPTATPEPTAIPNRWYDSTKNPEHAPDLDLLDLSDAHREDYETELSDPTRWIDLTPEGADGFTVIRSIDLGCSYVVQNGAYYRLGEGEDGKGALDVHLTDLDWDGKPDLLYTYHFGANEDQASKVGWFDLETHESALSGFSLQNGFLAIAEEDGAYALYRAERDADLDTGTFSLTFTERLGVLVETEGRIFLILD